MGTAKADAGLVRNTTHMCGGSMSLPPSHALRDSRCPLVAAQSFLNSPFDTVLVSDRDIGIFSTVVNIHTLGVDFIFGNSQIIWN